MNDRLCIKITALLALVLTLAAAPAEAPKAQNAAMPGGFGGDGPLEVTAETSMEWHEKESMYLARGDARAKRGDITIAADDLAAYQRKTKNGKPEIFKITARGHVVITSKTHRIEGDEGYYDADRQVAVLTGDNLKFTGPDETVTARDSLEYWQEKKQAVARGNAAAVQKGRRVTSDKMTAQFRDVPGAKNGGMELQQLTAEGQVAIVTPTDVARGDRAVYDINRNVAVMTGNVKVTRGDSQLEGAVAEVDLRTGISRMMASGDDRRIKALFVPKDK